MKYYVLASCLLLTCCHRYSDFTLPVLNGSAGIPHLEWRVRPEPVISRGSKVDVLNPSVFIGPKSLVNLFSSFDGKVWRTESSESLDGLLWTDPRVVLSPDAATWEGGYIAANGAAVRQGDVVSYFYQGGLVPQIGLATLDSNGSLRRHGDPVLRTGPRGSWDERGVADPYVIEVSGSLYMYYLGQDRARQQQLGVARSVDGVRWEKLRANPILELGSPGAFDEKGLGEPAVWSQSGWYWMLYTGRDKKEFRRLGLAKSRDGVRWERVTDRAVLEGSQPWNSKVVCDPTVMLKGDVLRVWFGGGNKPEPAENLEGQIGYAEMRLTMR